MSLVAVFASGRGSNLESLLEASREGRLGPAQIRVVVSDNESSRALSLARDHGVETVFVDPEGLSREAYDEHLVEVVRERDIDFIVLAGFLRILTRPLLEAFPHRIINIHPALLPSFKGLQAQRQALDRGVRIAGASTHLVTEDVDSGPIILQAAVPVRQDDTEESLSQRILRTEHRILPETVRLMAEGRLSVSQGHVEIKGQLRFPGTRAMVPEVTP